jgi:hypothetical protein
LELSGHFWLGVSGQVRVVCRDISIAPKKGPKLSTNDI